MIMTNPLKTRTVDINGKSVNYTDQSKFEIQSSLRPGGKSGFETRRTVYGNPATAVLVYNSLNIGNGYKKRLLVDGILLDRQAS